MVVQTTMQLQALQCILHGIKICCASLHMLQTLPCRVLIRCCNPQLPTKAAGLHGGLFCLTNCLKYNLSYLNTSLQQAAQGCTQQQKQKFVGKIRAMSHCLHCIWSFPAMHSDASPSKVEPCTGTWRIQQKGPAP